MYSRMSLDRIFGEECKTREVYEAKTRQLVAAAVAGFNGACFSSPFPFEVYFIRLDCLYRMFCGQEAACSDSFFLQLAQ